MEMDYQKLTESLLDNDSTTRDITFTPAEYGNVSRLLALLFTDYQKGSLSDQDGEKVALDVKVVSGLFQRETGSVYGEFESESALIKSLMLFLDWSEEGKCAVELSFFSDELSSTFTIEKFLTQLNIWWDALDATEVFVRYENASWEWYNPHDLGVFYHRKRI